MQKIFLIIFYVFLLLLLLFFFYQTVILLKTEKYMNMYGHILYTIVYNIFCIYVYIYRVFDNSVNNFHGLLERTKLRQKML